MKDRRSCEFVPRGDGRGLGVLKNDALFRDEEKGNAEQISILYEVPNEVYTSPV